MKLPERVPKWVVVLGVLPAVLAVGIFVFIARFAIAHDESRCPFHEVESRDLAPGVRVREEARRCIPEMEEHRWISERAGREALELGRFPLESDQIERGFPWIATIDDGRTVVTVENEGRGELVFREPAPPGSASDDDQRM